MNEDLSESRKDLRLTRLGKGFGRRQRCAQCRSESDLMKHRGGWPSLRKVVVPSV